MQPPEKLTLGTLLMLLGITTGALLLRFHNLEEWGLWVDELFSVQHAAELAAGRITSRFLAYLPTVIALELSGVDMSSVDPKEIWTWRAAGITEWNMRVHVALLGAISILILGLLGVRMFGARVSALLCLLLALSPWHLWMSQSARFYVQLFLLYNLASVALLSGDGRRRDPARDRRDGLHVVGLLDDAHRAHDHRHFRSGHRHNLVAQRKAAHASVLLGRRRRQPGGLHCRNPASPDGRHPRYFTFAGTPQPLAVMTMGTAYLVGTSMVVMAAFGFWAMLRSERKRLAILLLTSALLPLGIFAAFKLAGKDAHLRYLFVTLFPWLALAAVGIERIAATMQERWGTLASWLPAVALLSEFAVSDYVYMTGGAGYRGQWRQAMAYVAGAPPPW